MVGQWRVWGGGWPALYGSFMPCARARSHPPPATNISQPQHLIGLSPLPPSRSTDDSEVALGRRDKRKRPRGGEKRTKKKRECKRGTKKKKERKKEQMERGASERHLPGLVHIPTIPHLTAPLLIMILTMQRPVSYGWLTPKTGMAAKAVAARRCPVSLGSKARPSSTAGASASRARSRCSAAGPESLAGHLLPPAAAAGERRPCGA